MLITTHAVAGIISTIVITKLANQALTTPILLFGIVAAIIPDLDSIIFIFYNYIKKQPLSAGKWVYRHRILHFPLLFLLTGSLIVVLSKPWGIIFVIATLSHFILDTFASIYGVQWLFPFSKKQYVVCPLKLPLGDKFTERVKNGTRQKWNKDLPLSLRFSAELLIFIATTTFIVKSLCFS